MPSPKNVTRRASRSPRSGPRSGTRRASRSNAAALNADPLIEAMMHGNLKWGDLLYEASPPGKRSPAVRRAPTPYSPINDVFEGYKTPDLRLRKFIWENFPVVLEEIRTRNGTEKYAVKWHRRNLEEWRNTRTDSFEEAMEYELFSELRLIHSLRKHPHLYALQEPRSKDEIVVIEMLGPARTEARAESPKRAAAAAGPVVPILRKLNDITTFFPGVVVWTKVEGRKGESTYALSVRGDFSRKVDKKIADRVLGDLEAALRASRFWSVLPPKSGEYLRLEMSHD